MPDPATADATTIGPIVDWFRGLPPGDGVRITTCAVVAYVLGCLATGYYLVRIRTGKDIRTMESGNIGARNVGRVLGPSGFLITFLGDLAKGALAVLIARGLSRNDPAATAAAVVGALAGHLWPAPLGFRGGKGISTGLGALLVFDVHLALPMAAGLVAGFLLTRRSVPAGMLMFGVVPPWVWWQTRDPRLAALLGVAFVMIVTAHRSNLARDFAALGDNSRIPKPKSQPPAS
jgi:acyl-phosphate glycerol 3-phosphate acyltransferase